MSMITNNSVQTDSQVFIKVPFNSPITNSFKSDNSDYMKIHTPNKYDDQSHLLNGGGSSFNIIKSPHTDDASHFMAFKNEENRADENNFEISTSQLCLYANFGPEENAGSDHEYNYEDLNTHADTFQNGNMKTHLDKSQNEYSFKIDRVSTSNNGSTTINPANLSTNSISLTDNDLDNQNHIPIDLENIPHDIIFNSSINIDGSFDNTIGPKSSSPMQQLISPFKSIKDSSYYDMDKIFIHSDIIIDGNIQDSMKEQQVSPEYQAINKLNLNFNLESSGKGPTTMFSSKTSAIKLPHFANLESSAASTSINNDINIGSNTKSALPLTPLRNITNLNHYSLEKSSVTHATEETLHSISITSSPPAFHFGEANLNDNDCFAANNDKSNNNHKAVLKKLEECSTKINRSVDRNRNKLLKRLIEESSSQDSSPFSGNTSTDGSGSTFNIDEHRASPSPIAVSSKRSRIESGPSKSNSKYSTGKKKNFGEVSFDSKSQSSRSSEDYHRSYKNNKQKARGKPIKSKTKASKKNHVRATGLHTTKRPKIGGKNVELIRKNYRAFDEAIKSLPNKYEASKLPAINPLVQYNTNSGEKAIESSSRPTSNTSTFTSNNKIDTSMSTKVESASYSAQYSTINQKNSDRMNLDDDASDEYIPEPDTSDDDYTPRGGRRHHRTRRFSSSIYNRSRGESAGTNDRQPSDSTIVNSRTNSLRKSSKKKVAKPKKRILGPRSKTGCWTCRIRHKACPEERPICAQCERLNLSCDYSSQRPDYMVDSEKNLVKLKEIKDITIKQKKKKLSKNETSKYGGNSK